MDKPIAVGDLVQVVRTCCDYSTDLVGGKVGVVNTIITRSERCFCPRCKANFSLTKAAIFLRGKNDCAPLSWLKRIPPLSELEGDRTEENLREPA